MWGTPVGMTWHRLVQWRSWPTTSLPSATVHVGHGGYQHGAAPAPPLGTATMVSDTLIAVGHARLQGVEAGAAAMARPTDQHPARRGCTGAPKCARTMMHPRSILARPTASPGPETMSGHLSMTRGIACEQRACPSLPRPQLTILAHKKPGRLASLECST
jgi:hypothetical protein